MTIKLLILITMMKTNENQYMTINSYMLKEMETVKKEKKGRGETEEV